MDNALFQDGSIDTDPNAIGLSESLIQAEKGKKRWGRVYEGQKIRKGKMAQ